MRKIILAAATLLTLSQAQAVQFSGAYVGGNVAYGTVQQEIGSDVDASVAGIGGGVNIGFDQMFGGRWLLGGEGFVDFTQQKQVGESFGALAKAGHIIDTALVYVTGGIVSTKLKGSTTASGTTFGASSKRFNGFTLGAGVAIMVTSNAEVGFQWTHDFYTKSAGVKLARDTARIKIAYKV